MKALVVDDSRIMRMMVRKQLHSCGLSDDDIREAGDGLDALDAIAANTPDLVLADVNMPNMDGERFLYEAANTGFLETGRVVMVTSRYERRLFGRLLGNGASAIIRKPFTTDSFRRRLEPVLQEIVDAREGRAVLTSFSPPHEQPTRATESPVAMAPDDQPALSAAKATVQVLQTLGLSPTLDTPDTVPGGLAAYAEIQIHSTPRGAFAIYGDREACTAISLATLGLPAEDDERCAEVLAEITNIAVGKWLAAAKAAGSIGFGNPTSGLAAPEEVVLRGMEGVAVGNGHLLVAVFRG